MALSNMIRGVGAWLGASSIVLQWVLVVFVVRLWPITAVLSLANLERATFLATHHWAWGVVGLFAVSGILGVLSAVPVILLGVRGSPEAILGERNVEREAMEPPQWMAQQARALGLKTPELWVLDTPRTQAFALYFRRRPVVVLTRGMLRLLKDAPELLRWVVAHELGHLHHGHSKIAEWGNRWIRLAEVTGSWMDARLAPVAERLFGWTGLYGLGVWLLGEFVCRSIRLSFVFLTKGLYQAGQRRGEIEADRVAARLEGIAPGIRLLDLIERMGARNGFEWLSSHPSHEARRQALWRQSWF